MRSRRAREAVGRWEPRMAERARNGFDLPPHPWADLHVQVVLQQALVRIGEAGRRFAQCLLDE